MTTLEDAWAWYEAVSAGMGYVDHLAKFWDDVPWGSGEGWAQRVERDNVLREVAGSDLRRVARNGLEHLDDLAIVVLFSVFEAIVRELAIDQMAAEKAGLQHPVLQKAAKDAEEDAELGSFARLLEPFKRPDTVDLLDQVNQVRQYRNWVAHGRQETKRKTTAVVDPGTAYRRLTQFLDMVRAG